MLCALKMATFEVPQATRDSDRPAAFLVNFTNGQLTSDEGISFRMFEGTERGKPVKSLVAETNSMTYIGKSNDILAPQLSNNGMKNMVAIYDKKRHKVRVYNSEIFTLQPHIPEKDDEEEVIEKNSEGYREKVDSLISAFGGRRKKMAMESRQRNAIGSSELGGAMSRAVEGVLETSRDVLDAVEETHPMSVMLPRFNLEATTCTEAFPFQGVIGDEVLTACKLPAHVFVDASMEDLKNWKSNSTYPSYIIEYVKRLPLEPNARLHKSACLVYLNHLFFMFRLAYKDLRKKDCFPPEMPSTVKTSLKDLFTLSTTTVGRTPTVTMPARMKDKVLSYLLVLCLHLEEFCIEYNSLLADLKVSQIRLKNHLQAMGCKLSQKTESGQKHVYATLVAPLKFGETPMRRQKRS